MFLDSKQIQVSANVSLKTHTRYKEELMILTENMQNFNSQNLLGHSWNSVDAFLVLLVVFLKSQEFVSRLLGEQLDSDTLVVHGDFRLTTYTGSRKGITHTPRPVLIFLDWTDQLVTSFDIDLSSFNDFL